ncbi:MAG: hypothetical protein LBU58_05745 [Clostridiales bacterium]|jgi:hypothetical protein|nr:hypothetical protein [Clostridiales bacterium]
MILADTSVMKLRKTLCYSDAPYIVSLTRLIETQSKPTIISWCVDYAGRYYLPIWEKYAPDDTRPRIALEMARRWLSKEVKCQTVRDAAWDSHLAAKDRTAYPAAEAAARAIANAALTCHVATHSIRVAFYGVAAVAYDRAGLCEPPEIYDAIASDECARFEAALRAIAVEDEPNPVPCKWSDMNNSRPLPSEARERQKPL